ncbi:hypothetical protein Zm00014a_002575 [Zea mays]|uniref:Uncharacterized protein n=1 Tax=Zea mays TaxID=4577 RepID=A0A3L6FHP9_MAIZE|nr:hypothetical protein Zm00014a_002575 [Zea mays]
MQRPRARRLPRCRSRSRCCRRRALTSPASSTISLPSSTSLESTIRQCTTHGRLFRWRCALSACITKLG